MSLHISVGFAVLFLLPVFVQGADDKVQDGNKNGGITSEQADEILSELRQIRQLLQGQSRQTEPSQRAVPLTGTLKLDDGKYSLGLSDAPITIVEFTDYECPYCQQFQSTTFGEIRKKYVDAGRVRFVIRDFPLDNHPNAIPAAEAANCAADQEQFWPMSQALFASDGKLTRQDFIDHAEALKLDIPLFRSCLDGRKHKQDIQNDKQVAASLQIQATPSFLIGKTNGDNVSGSIIQGALPLKAFDELIRKVEAVR